MIKPLPIHELHPACLPLETLVADCSVTRTRRSGPGGQHRNKVETAVVIEHRPSGLRAEASESRSQERNKSHAIQRLRLLLATELRSEFSTPSALWQQRLRKRQMRVNPNHEDFPAVVAEALNAIASNEGDTAQAAEVLDISHSQLAKLLKQHARAFAAMNKLRALHDLRPLR